MYCMAYCSWIVRFQLFSVGSLFLSHVLSSNCSEQTSEFRSQHAVQQGHDRTSAFSVLGKQSAVSSIGVVAVCFIVHTEDGMDPVNWALPLTAKTCKWVNPDTASGMVPSRLLWSSRNSTKLVQLSNLEQMVPVRSLLESCRYLRPLQPW